MNGQTLADIKEEIERIEHAIKGTSLELKDIPVVMTDDDEFNGIHTAWGDSSLIDTKSLIDDLESTYAGISIPDSFRKKPYLFLVQ